MGYLQSNTRVKDAARPEAWRRTVTTGLLDDTCVNIRDRPCSSNACVLTDGCDGACTRKREGEDQEWQPKAVVLWMSSVGWTAPPCALRARLLLNAAAGVWLDAVSRRKERM